MSPAAVAATAVTEERARALSDLLLEAAGRGTFMGLDIGGSLSKLVIVDPGSGSAKSALMAKILAFVTGRAEFGQTGRRDEHLELRLDEGVVVHLVRFQTRRMAGALALAKEQLRAAVHAAPAASGIGAGELGELNCTGGGARKFEASFAERAGLRLRAHDELTCLVRGLTSLLRHGGGTSEAFTVDPDDGSRAPLAMAGPGVDVYPLVLVNVGSGVSIVLVEGPGTWRRVSGTPIGGGTFFGLTNMLTGLTSFDTMLELAARGDHTRVNLTVGDIYGEGESVYGLRPDHIAANFGKPLAETRHPTDAVAGARDGRDDVAASGGAAAGDAAAAAGVGEQDGSEAADDGGAAGFLPDGRFRASQEDVCAATLVLVTDQVAQAAVLTARQHGVRRVLFAGSFLRHGGGSDAPHRRLSWAVSAWSGGRSQAAFLRREGYYGALGALLVGGEAAGRE